MSAIKTCVICDEKVNKTKHALVCCEYCSFEACRECCKTYLVDQYFAKCMNGSCGKEWTRKFISTSLPHSFLEKEWKQSRAKILFDRQSALLPATQPILERRIAHFKNMHEYRCTWNQISDIRKKIIKEKDTVMKEQLLNNQRELETRYNELYRIVNGGGINRTSAAAPAESQNNFVRACPSEDCRGFLSQEWNCGLCKKETCSKCHIIKNDSHTCNPDDVATAKLLMKDTKPCPKCHTGIFKIDGCDQMWCTQCHTAFSWRTGEVETRIHNPHYYEWQRQNNNGVAPRVEGDHANQPCQDRQLTQNLFEQIRRHHKKIGGQLTNLSLSIIRDTIHLKYSDMREYEAPRNDVHLESRILYLDNKIDKETFIRRVRKDSKKLELHREIRQVLDMFVNVVSDIMHEFYQMILRDASNDVLSLKIGEVETLRIYVNDILVDIFRSFQYQTRQIQKMDDVRAPHTYHRVLLSVDVPLKKVEIVVAVPIQL